MKRETNQKQNIRNNKGITLIALVVTIVVLLILAGVSIGMLAGENGIIRQAIESKENTRGGSAKEEIDIWKSNVKMDGLTGSTTAEEQDNLLDRLVENETLTQEEADKLKEGETIKIGDIEISLGEGSGNDTTIAGKNYETETDITIGETPVTVPGGATISGIEGEYKDPEEGIVIYIIPEDEQEEVDWAADTNNNQILDVQEKYDQFVWVPVPNAVAESDTDLATKNGNGIYPMAVATEGTDSKGKQNYRGVLYDFAEATDAEGKKYVKITAKSWSADSITNREPAYLTSTSSADGSSYNNIEPKITDQLLQEEYNTMVERVKSKKGFWVGRYETSNMVGTATTSNSDALNKATVEADKTNRVTVIRGTTTGISYDSTIPNYINWYRMYAQQKNYSKLALEETSSATSSMIWGSQWDQIMIWMKEVENTRVPANGKYFVTNSVGYGNYASISGAEGYDAATSEDGPAATGSSEYFKVKNVYDLAGNIHDWSLEANSTSYRVYRGGSYDTTGTYMAANRGTNNPFFTNSGRHGSRTTLY